MDLALQERLCNEQQIYQTGSEKKTIKIQLKSTFGLKSKVFLTAIH